MSKTILFIHQNYPAQFGRLARYMKKEGWNVYFATAREGIERGKINQIDDINVLGFEAHRKPTKGVHNYIRDTEMAILNGQGFANMGRKMKNSGIEPDLIVAHSGWGSGAFAKVIWPNAKYIQYLEWWYRYPGRDVWERPDPTKEADNQARVLGRNLTFLLDFQTADAVWAPTEFQAQDFPDFIRPKLRIAFDGVDTELMKPCEKNVYEKFNTTEIAADQKLLTYATRGMEPQRGFPEFMAALSDLQKERDDFECVIAGEPTIHYSPKLPKGQTYKDLALQEFEYDHERLHFVGRLAYERYRDLLARSDAHVYLTRPFVISWSFFEAASCAAPMIVSEGDCTRQVLPDDKMAKYVDMKDRKALVEAMSWMLDHREEGLKMGQAARARIEEKYSRKELYPAHIQFFEDVIEGRFPRTSS